MGMFDTVQLECPHCRLLSDHQSKAGACTLSYYTLEAAPLEILADLAYDSNQGDLYCGRCSGGLEVKVQYMARVQKRGDSLGGSWQET